MKNDSLCQAIAREEAQLADLTHKRNESRERLAVLRAELANMESTPVAPSAPAIQPTADIPTTVEGKISLFRQLFRGRDDVPVSWKGTLIQYAGRLHRLHPDKTEVRIYDYVDSGIPMFVRMFERRLRGYRAIGYSAEKVTSDL